MAVTLTNLALVISSDKEAAYSNAWYPPLIAVYQALDAQLTSWTFDTDYNDKVQSRMVIKDSTLEWVDSGNKTGSFTLDYRTAHVQKITLTGNATLTNITAWSPSGVDGRIEVHVMQDATGGRTLSFGSSFDFGDNGAPTITTTANRGDVLVFRSRDNGTTKHLVGISTGFTNL
jgi:hypothetical protein